MATPTEESLAQAREAEAVLNRCNTENPSPEDIAALRKYLRTMPELWKQYGDLASLMTSTAIEAMNAPAGLRESVYAGRRAMRRELGYQKSPLLEQMLIDHLILCWLRLQVAEHKYTDFIKRGGAFIEAGYWEKHLSATQRRYLRAVETLARIRKMALPTIQVNIGDRQVNVAGG